MRSDRAPVKRKYWAAFIFLVLGAGAGVWHNNRVRSGKPDYAAGFARGIVAIPARALSSSSRWFARQTAWITERRRLVEDNRSLRQQVEELKGRNNQLMEAQVNYDRLRSDLGFANRPAAKLVAADVVAFRTDPKFDTMIIGRGTSDGIKPNSVVITKDGVVGRVVEAEPGTSSVLLLTDQKSGIGARVQRSESRAVAVCEGENVPTLSMLGLQDSADIRLGDNIVTSGLGGVYPAGLLIGSVCELKPDVANGGRIVRIRPQVKFDTLEQVYVIK